MKKPTIRLIVTDLDNTLYDWVSYFVVAFYRMVDVAVDLLAVPRDTLLDDLRTVHRRYHDSEYPFALLETDCVVARYPNCDRKERKRLLKPAFDAFNEARDSTLALYPTVKETLRLVAAGGVAVVGHTEASVPNAIFRLTKLNCIDLFKRLYALEHTGQAHPEPDRASKYDLPIVRKLHGAQRKPNPAVLLEICSDLNVAPGETLYVGDSIARDIGMARAAGVWSAYAEYGTRFAKTHWNDLVRVTHWTDEDISRNEAARAKYGNTQADAVLDTSFAQILDSFEFANS